jgi:hypothetical protein
LCRLETVSEETPHHRLSWLALLLFVLGCALAVLWMVVEVKQTQRHKSFMYPPATNSAVTNPATTNR